MNRFRERPRTKEFNGRYSLVPTLGTGSSWKAVLKYGAAYTVFRLSPWLLHRSCRLRSRGQKIRDYNFVRLFLKKAA